MKVKYIGILLLALLAFYGCDDNTGTLGMGMLPDSDGISAQTKTFEVSTKSILAGPVYAKTSTGYVGTFTDPDPNGFGNYKASFLTELNCADDFRFLRNTTTRPYGNDGRRYRIFRPTDNILRFMVRRFFESMQNVGIRIEPKINEQPLYRY